MHNVIRAGELTPSPGGTVTFERDPYGSGVSFFLVDNEPGNGPDLHRHPYSETWIVHSGQGAVHRGRRGHRGGPGRHPGRGAGDSHKFKNVGTGRLDVVCIHASPKMIQEALE
jgi:mannose-6-phosphate isomerase-like protein (cupin superfamily)